MACADRQHGARRRRVAFQLGARRPRGAGRVDLPVAPRARHAAAALGVSTARPSAGTSRRSTPGTSAYFEPTRPFEMRQLGRAVGADIVQIGEDHNGIRRRWRFVEIAERAFRCSAMRRGIAARAGRSSSRCARGGCEGTDAPLAWARSKDQVSGRGLPDPRMVARRAGGVRIAARGRGKPRPYAVGVIASPMAIGPPLTTRA